MVDSGSEINELLDRVFASESWSVEHVPDNCAALITAAANPFDLIITGSKNRTVDATVRALVEDDGKLLLQIDCERYVKPILREAFARAKVSAR